jgi:cytoskeletal protein CcmA (bactofilin family)
VGEVITERVIINGTFEGICRATYIEILSSGRISGTVYSDNLSIEPGGKFMGVTNPAEEVTQKPPVLEQKSDDDFDVSTLNTTTNRDTLDTDTQH